MRERFMVLLMVSVLLAGAQACERNDMNEQANQIKSSPQKAEISWQKLSGHKIYFGHQSVGNNLLDGVRDIMKENPSATLRIIETDGHSDITAGTLAHSSVGKNNDPVSKIEDFRDKIDNGLGDNVDIAFFKFCFVDIDSRTDVNGFFEKYRATLAELKARYPETTFAHCTIPLLRKEEKSLKNWVKGLLGKEGGFFDNRHNRARNEFNELLINEYQGKEPVFDLAGVTSTHSDGSRETFAIGASKYFALVPGYTDDGGHLNLTGRKIAAEQFLVFLSEI